MAALSSAIGIATDRIRLRQLKSDDHHLLNLLNHDEGVMTYLDHAPPSLEEVHAQVLRIIDDYTRWPTLGQWIAESPAGEFFGWFALTPRSRDAAPPVIELELGYRLRRRVWGDGVATEGSRMLIQYAFRQHPSVDRVVGTTMFVNRASRRVMEKTGMRHVETFHLEFDDPVPGTEFGEVLYEVTREDWVKGRQHVQPGTDGISL